MCPRQCRAHPLFCPSQNKVSVCQNHCLPRKKQNTASSSESLRCIFFASSVSHRYGKGVVRPACHAPHPPAQLFHLPQRHHGAVLSKHPLVQITFPRAPAPDKHEVTLRRRPHAQLPTIVSPAHQHVPPGKPSPALPRQQHDGMRAAARELGHVASAMPTCPQAPWLVQLQKTGA